MEDQFDLKKFLIENKLTNLSLREEDNDWDIEVGEEWNVQELGIDDYITPEMFQDNKYGNEFKALNQSFKIVRFKVNNTTLPNGDINTIYYFNIEYKDRFGKTQQQNYQVKSFNKYFLKPQYKVVPPDDLNEQQDDEWDLEVDKEWGVQELSIGDVITPDMWERPTYWFDKVDTTIVDFSNDGAGSAFVKLEAPDNISTEEYTYKVSRVNFWLKPQYKIISPLTEQEDDECDINVSDKWDEHELYVGDYITPEMWDMDGVKEYLRSMHDGLSDEEFEKDLQKFLKDTNKRLKIKGVNRYGRVKLGNLFSNLWWDPWVKELNDMLKPQYKLTSLFDDYRFNIAEQDEEWDITTDAFDVQELTVGDKITPNMWDKKAVIDAGEEDEFLNDEIWIINDVRNGWGIDMTSNGGGSIGWNIDDVQALLKPQYKIVAP